MIELTTPVSGEQILKLHAGDRVRLSGIAVTGRDAAHKYMVEKLIEGAPALSAGDRKLYDELNSILRGGAIYHCGPIVRREGEKWSFLSAAPTTSIRDEIYQDKVIKAFGIRFVIGKGGMGQSTLAACKEHGAVYLHGIGGAGVYAASAAEVLDVFKAKEFGMPEAFWKIRFDRFPGVVTMDAHGNSLHDDLAKIFDRRLEELVNH